MFGVDSRVMADLLAGFGTGGFEASDSPDSEGSRARFIAGVAWAIAGHHDIRLPPLRLLEEWGSPVPVTIPREAARPEVLGSLHEALLDRRTRRRGGAFYTPSDVADVVVHWGLGTSVPDQRGWHRHGQDQPGARDRHMPVVCDPAVGGGAFLLAAADALASRGLDPELVVRDCLIGADLDPVAVAVSEASLALWCGGRGVPRLVVADALTIDAREWPEQPDVVVGNPPFLSQLGLATVRSRRQAKAIEHRLGEGMGGYADTAALFWVMACRLVRPGGRVALILPQSTLAVRDAQGARRAVLDEGMLEVLWLPGRPLFGAAVDVCVAVVHKRRAAYPHIAGDEHSDETGVLRTCTGVPPLLHHESIVARDELRDAANWSHLVADAMDVPVGALEDNGETIGHRWQVVADFRDQYYGVAPFVVDDPDDQLDEHRHPRLITVGLVDPARCLWGRVPARFARRAWKAPRVDLAALEATGTLGPWARSRLVPKVVVATQTSVVEAAVDESGIWLPSTPVISVLAEREDLWHVAAVLSAPPVSMWAIRAAAGAALARGGLKLRAGQVRDIPLPRDPLGWNRAAELMREASHAGDPLRARKALLAAATAASEAYGLGTEITEWWSARLPTPR